MPVRPAHRSRQMDPGSGGWTRRCCAASPSPRTRPRLARLGPARFGAGATRKGCGPRPCRPPSKTCRGGRSEVGPRTGTTRWPGCTAARRGSPRGRGPRWMQPCSGARRLQGAGQMPSGRKVVGRSGFAGWRTRIPRPVPPTRGSKRGGMGGQMSWNTKVIRARV